MKHDPKAYYTIAPVTPLPNQFPKPEFIRLPIKGRCPYTGLTRYYFYQLIQPTNENGYNPPVKSVSLRLKGQARGVRLVHYDSLLEYLYEKMKTPFVKKPT